RPGHAHVIGQPVHRLIGCAVVRLTVVAEVAERGREEMEMHIVVDVSSYRGVQVAQTAELRLDGAAEVVELPVVQTSRRLHAGAVHHEVDTTVLGRNLRYDALDVRRVRDVDAMIFDVPDPADVERVVSQVAAKYGR